MAGHAGSVAVFVEGIPKAQPRPRAYVRKSGRAGVFDPGTAAGWRARIAAVLAPLRPRQPLEGPMALHLGFLLPRPRGHYGKRGLKPSAPPHPVGRPDIDNLVKACADELSQLGWWRDDSQLVRLSAEKRYAELEDRAGVAIVVGPVIQSP